MKLKLKIIIQNIAAILLMLIIIGPIIVEITDNYNLSTILKYLDSQGNYAAIYSEQYALNKAKNIFEIPSTLENDAPYLCALIKRTTKCRVQIFDNTKLIGDSEDIIENFNTMRPEIKESLKGKKAYYIKKDKSRIFYFATPLAIANKYNYSIGFVYDLSDADKMKKNTINIFLISGFFASLFVTFLSTIISNRITYPINMLTKAATNYSNGDFNERVQSFPKDEIGKLSNTFNQMADSIQNKIEKIKDEKEKQKSFFDNFTHEIRTPLTTIIGYTELLWKTDNEEFKDKSLFHISSESQRMLKMVETLLELSRLKKFDFEPDFSKVNLKTLIEEVCDSMQYKAKRYGIKINLNLYDTVHMVDPNLFKQIIINLLDNSIKYSKSPTVDIELKNTNKIFLSIIDYGCGIDSKNLDSIFEPYFKIDKCRNSKSEGFGLGLSIVREIVKKHNGEISIESSLDKGTKVNIIFNR